MQLTFRTQVMKNLIIKIAMLSLLVIGCENFDTTAQYAYQSPEEIQDRYEFIRCYLMQELEPLTQIPLKGSERGFVITDYLDPEKFHLNSYPISFHPLEPYYI